MNKKLVNYLEPFNVIYNQQYGCRSGKSTTKAVRKILLKVEGLDKGDNEAVLLCDLSKTFDCLTHLLLHGVFRCPGNMSTFI